MANPSAVQETAAAPMDPRSEPPTHIAPSVNEPAPAQKTGPRQAITKTVTVPALPGRITSRQQQSVEKQDQTVASPNVPPQVVAPTDLSQSTPSETVTPAPSSSPPAKDTAHTSSSELTPSAAPVEEPAVSSSRETSMVARVPLDRQPDVAPTRIPDASSSTGHSPNLSPPVQEARMSKPDFSWLTDSLRGRVQQSQKYSTVARLNGLEGRVVLRITVKENGELLVAIATSSGHALLDQDAVEQVTRLSPLPLVQPLGRAQQVLNLPIIYSLNQ